jgi:Domain of unknown function (DUF4283)
MMIRTSIIVGHDAIQIVDGNFMMVMAKMWNLRLGGNISTLAKNTCLVEVATKEALFQILDKGVWTYRGDTVVLKQPLGPTDLGPDFVDSMEIWMQLHNIPLRLSQMMGYFCWLDMWVQCYRRWWTSK